MFVLWICAFMAVAQSSSDDLYEGDEPGECSDGADNDRDGAFDCDDSQCAGAPVCQTGATGEDAKSSEGDTGENASCAEGSGKSCAEEAQVAFDESRFEDALELSDRGCEMGNNKSCKLAGKSRRAIQRTTSDTPEDQDVNTPADNETTNAESPSETPGIQVLFQSERTFYLQCGSAGMRKHRPSGGAPAIAEYQTEHPSNCTFTQSGLNQKLWIDRSRAYYCQVDDGAIDCSVQAPEPEVTQTEPEPDPESTSETNDECVDRFGNPCDEDSFDNLFE